MCRTLCQPITASDDLWMLIKRMLELRHPQRDLTEIIIEIKQIIPGRLASHAFIESNRRYIVYPLNDSFTIENGLLD